MKDLISINDFSSQELRDLFDISMSLKANPFNDILSQRSMAMIFEKPSLRTRATFEIGMTQLGGHALYLQPQDIKLGERESVADVARNLERWVDIIMARTFLHQTIIDLAKNASIPVINALSDIEHPCQALADFLTILEHKKSFDGLKLAFVGDGNNVCHSLMILSAKLGVSFSLACPQGYEPMEQIVSLTQELMNQTGAEFNISEDVNDAVSGADAIYTDVWVSMGQETETADRKKLFAPYQVNSSVVSVAKSDVIVMHCLPAHRGEEITDEVIDGPHSVVFDQAENRLHAQKAVIIKLLKKEHLIKE